MNMELLYNTGHMFLFLSVELTLLFIGISYLVGILQEYITPSKIQSILSAKHHKGYVISAFLGSISPFCSCSTIPFLKGLIRAGAGFGPMMVFLIASPLLNPIIIGLFIVTFGFKVALFYFLIALITAICSGYLLEKVNFERYIKKEAYTVLSEGCSSSTTSNNENPSNKKEVETPIQTISMWKKVWLSTWKDFKQVLPYLLLGISIGSFIYGFIPTEFIIKYTGNNSWFAIPIAAIIGIPLYIRAEAVIPLSAALVKKGMALGSVMALIIGSAGASLTEVILLRSIFHKQIIIAFLIIILSMAVFAGTVYSYLF